MLIAVEKVIKIMNAKNVHQHAKVKERVKCARGYIIRRFVKNQKI